MLTRPLLLDLFCGAGGCSVGYHRAGFDVCGIDHEPQPRYPFPFLEADALDVVRGLIGGACILGHYLEDFAAIHASPPCQGYSVTKAIHQNRGGHLLLVEEVRSLLAATGKPYVIENVPGSPMQNAVMLCGTMFDLRVYRHRWFECSELLMIPAHPKHRHSTGSHRGYSYQHDFVTVAGHNFNREEGAAAMGIDWMTRDELSQAIPPAYCEFVGKQLLRVLDAGQAPA